MAFTLKYRNSFIDAEDRMPEGDDRMRRASSLPPRISKMVEVEEILEDEESLQCYVQKLSEDLSKSLDRSPLARCNRGSSPPGAPLSVRRDGVRRDGSAPPRECGSPRTLQAALHLLHGRKLRER
ncbi:unnamed protein product [Durusdinium trenchii]|uniref:Uncharacterized protein n=1 Tax=Durusdinium trenchii TaxID=1381693 RepID=A0ABP0N1R6_9DINO